MYVCMYVVLLSSLTSRYCNSQKTRSLARVYKGDLVRCELDMDAGTLSYAINGEDHGIAFTNMNEFGTVYPCVAFYSSGRSVCVRVCACVCVDACACVRPRWC